MTRIEIHETLPDGAPAIGRLRFAPTRRRHDDDTVVLPSPFTVSLDTDGRAVVELAPTDSTWCWRVQELLQVRHVRHVSVPDSLEPVSYTALVDVDPNTLDPAAEPEAAWWAALGGATRAWVDSLPVIPFDISDGNVLAPSDGEEGYYRVMLPADAPDDTSFEEGLDSIWVLFQVFIAYYKPAGTPVPEGWLVASPPEA